MQAAQDVFNADEAGDIHHIPRRLTDLLHAAESVYTDIGGSAGRKSSFQRFLQGGDDGGVKVDGLAKVLQHATVRPLRNMMNELRVNKSEAELNCMRRAASLSAQVFTSTMGRPHTSEKRLHADIAHGFQLAGLDAEAYVPVVAGGRNALSIHYVRNDALLRAGEMVLVDAGGEYGGYITDITRTWPVNGRFKDAQRELYEVVLHTQTTCLEQCRETASVSLDSLHRLAETTLRSGLADLGFDMSRRDALETLFPHHVGHYIGLDVHDAPGYPRGETLMRGQCVTVEPGVYVPDEGRWPEKFRGVGVRIEDSVVVGREGGEVLTREAVKGVREIEGLRG